ncbi:MAG: TRAP transporter fused permease subunit [Alphaproteobacteria bacterium]|nr:TRAP transporter fused permease subunit [Alphaproteobacteria bacterium]
MRQIEGLTGRAIATWSAIAAAIHFYYAFGGWPEPLEQRALHLGVFMPIVFLLFPATHRSPRSRPSALDVLLAALAVLPSLYCYVHAEAINLRSEYLTPLTSVEVGLGILLVGLVLECLRRAVTPILAFFVIAVLAYLCLCDYLPGMWHYRQLSLEHIVETLYLIPDRGVYGPLLGISASVVAIFLIFGSFVQVSGTGRLFGNFGTTIAGRYSGGPAKVAVISSALFGTMSGSSVSNVATTGAFTIPMMKSLGYRPAFAGAVEAAASVGGAIMPPVMGAAAFVMAEVTAIPYRTIAVAAAPGAVLYYMAILLMVHFEAKRLGLAGLPATSIPGWRVVAEDAHLMIPIAALMALLTIGFSAQFSAFWSIVAVVVVSWLRTHTRVTPKLIFQGFSEAGVLIALLAVTVAAAGIIVAGLTTTGLVLAMVKIIKGLSGGSLLGTAVLVMGMCLMLGMGVPTTPSYIIATVIAAPIMVDVGPSLLAVHLFVFYFAILADVTPPVSVASYAAAAIAGSDPMKTGFYAARLAVGGFLVAYTYLYEPQLMLSAGWGPATEAFLMNGASLVPIAGGLIGYMRAPLAPWARAILLVVGMAVSFGQDMPTVARGALALLGTGPFLLWPAIFMPRRPPREMPAQPQ